MVRPSSPGPRESWSTLVPPDVRTKVAKALLPLCLLLLTGGLTRLYYGSDLRQRVENKWFDLRTRLAPDTAATDPVVLVEIDQAAIDALESSVPESTVAPRDLSFAALGRLIDAALAAGPAQVAVLLPPQVFPYDQPEMATIVGRAQQDQRLLLGTFGLSTTSPEGAPPSLLPATLQTLWRAAPPQLVKADIIRDYRRDLIRRFKVAAPHDLPFLVPTLVSRLDPIAGQRLLAAAAATGERMELSYIRPDRLPKVSARELSRGAVPKDRLAGRTVLIGYTAFRPWTFRDLEATHVNAPWQAEGADVSTGLSVLELTAIAFLNGLHGSWLTMAPDWLGPLATVVLAAAALLVWRASIAMACLWFVIGWVLLLVGHALLFGWLKVHVPLTDTAFWTALATIAGALLRLRQEGLRRADEEARLGAEVELARIQDRFLARFATELDQINGQVFERLKNLAATLAGAQLSPSQQAAHAKAVASSTELGVYLNGILGFANLRRRDVARPTLAPVDLPTTVAAVARQFEARLEARALRLEVDVPIGLRVLSNGPLTMQILENLVANAVKYAPQASSITVQAVQDGPDVLLSVRDHGPGIAAEYHERIFDKFYRITDDRHAPVKGHGLGLYLSRYFAAQMGATLAVTSTPGEGATFTLTLRAERRSREVRP